jgi:hypothetical protein
MQQGMGVSIAGAAQAVPLGTPPRLAAAE